MLLRYDPFREFERMLQGPGPRSAMVPMDAYRKSDRFIVHFDMPGVDPGSIDLTVEKNALTVKAERNWQPAEDEEVLIAERPQGTFSRQIMLSETLDVDHMEAVYDSGVLTLTIPVAEQAKPRKVEVSSVNGSHQSIGAGNTEPVSS